jgi:poly-gamma-glutamate synthesis protein (capsule biosynthesis protein)
MSPIEVNVTGNACTLFLCGDVMTGRGVDQILPFPSDPALHEPQIDDARLYRQLAERAHGAIPSAVAPDYPWGDALDEWERVRPDARIVNLETAVTWSNNYWKEKSIHYRMSPRNIECLTAAHIDCCVLANNHVLDWGYSGLAETLATLHSADEATSGAGENRTAAEAPAVLKLTSAARVLVFSFGTESSGIPVSWRADDDRPGVNLLGDLSNETVRRITTLISRFRSNNDVVVASLHWGSNWGFEVPREQQWFAHRLIDDSRVDIVHGHSSHHVKGIEVYHDNLILYGCGDFLTDYEGISGYDDFRNDLALMYFVTVEVGSGRLIRLDMTPLQVRQFRLRRALDADVAWIKVTLQREGKSLGTQVATGDAHPLSLRWTSKSTGS